ncbi:MAG: NlpC/P60 family protein [Faecalibacterium prausnitzii]|nr:NlpC/P60 family protein [Faecalibacterium prausnitzii]
MKKIKEKPTLSERIMEKAVSTPRELLRKGLDDGSERLRTQLRDTAQHGQADEYGGDTIEDTAARGLRRAEKELTRQRKKKPQEQPPEGGALAADGTGQRASAIKTKGAYIGAQTETQVTVAAEPQRQGQRVFMEERGRKAARWQAEQKRAVSRHQVKTAQAVRSDGGGSAIPGRMRSEQIPHIKERAETSLPKPVQKDCLPVERDIVSALPRSRKMVDTAKTLDVAQKQTAMLQSSARTAREVTVQAARYQQATKAAQSAAQKASQAAGRALRAILSAARSLAAAMMAGGSTVLSMVLVICLIGLLLASPFGIFFSDEDSGTGYTMPEAVTMLNMEFADRIEQIKAENPHDELDMDNAGSAAMISNWRDVLAVYAVRTTTDNASPDEVATLTEEKMEILREIFWDMNTITYWTKIVPGGKDEADTVILHITVTIKTHLQMADEHQFNTEQRRLLEELMQPKYQELFMVLTGSYQDIELSPNEVAKIIENLPADLSENRKQVVLTAYQLLGKVHYFWGGKSLIIGWDSRWGMPMKVTAEGSSTTGTVRPFGLDCSGMVDWVFYNQSGGQYVIGHGGGATAQHSYCTPIAWSDAQPGDLVFYPGDSHVGIVCGFDSSGNIMVIHCASSENNVVVTGKSGFTSIGRPEYFAD